MEKLKRNKAEQENDIFPNYDRILICDLANLCHDGAQPKRTPDARSQNADEASNFSGD